MTTLAASAMHIVFCADRRVIPGLHVAAFSLLQHLDVATTKASFHLFSEDFTEADVDLLKTTLDRTGRVYGFTRHRVSPTRFARFPVLHGSHATYYRLIAPEEIDAERFLYVDADIVCDIDVAPLRTLPLGNAPAAWVPEAPLSRAVDRQVAEQLGNSPAKFYFNAGVMLVNVDAWRSQRITQRAIKYLAVNKATFHDQSALNYVLHGSARSLEARFNCIANQRPNWEALRRPYEKIGKLVHFPDYPKPWDFLGEVVHPQHTLWSSVLKRTAIRGFRSWHRTPARRLFLDTATFSNYKKSLKDRILFTAYRRGWLRRVKGISARQANLYERSSRQRGHSHS